MVQVAKKKTNYFSVSPQFSCMILNKSLRFHDSQVPHEKNKEKYFPSLLDTEQQQIIDYQLISD